MLRLFGISSYSPLFFSSAGIFFSSDKLSQVLTDYSSLNYNPGDQISIEKELSK